MKNIVFKSLVLFTVFLPFLYFGLAMAIIPNPLHVLAKVSGMEYIWLIMFGAMMLGLLYWMYSFEEEEEITEEFRALDTDHDGYVTREEACRVNRWNFLYEEFDGIDTDHDGRISRQEFGKFEKMVNSPLNHLVPQ
jgi:Ca2+-binding EF-hand superfamily protein